MKSLFALALVMLMSGCSLLRPAQAPLETQYQVGNKPAQGSRVKAESSVSSAKVTVLNPQPGVNPPQVLASPFPEYPDDWQGRGIAGTVTVEFDIDEQGAVSNLALAGSPPPELAAISVHALLRWKFKPAERNGSPVRVHSRQVFNFVLD